MPPLHIPTLLAAMVVLVSFSGLATFLLWRRNRDEDGLRLLAGAYLSGAISAVFVGSLGHLSQVFSIVLTNFFTSLALAGLVEGLRRFYSQPARWVWMPTAASVHAGVSIWWTWIQPAPQIRAFFTGGVLLVYSLACLWVIRRWSRRATRTGSGMLSIAMAIYAGLAVQHLWYQVGRPEGQIALNSTFAVGTILCVLIFLGGLFMVVTERQIERLKALRATAVEGERSKARFLAVMSHEIRTPMNGVLGLSELLLRGDMGTPQEQLTLGIRSSGRALLRVLDDVLDLSKIEADRMELERSPFRTRELVAEVETRMLELASRRGLGLRVEVGADVPEVVIGDSGRVGQVLINLLGHGVELLEQGQLSLDVGVGRPGEVRFDVADTGPGISSERLERLFRPFHQREPGSGRRFGGAGLGLAICKQIVDLMGGHIEVEGGTGRGTTFSVTLPLPPADGALGVQEICLREIYFDEVEGVTGPPSTRDPSALRILVAEDDPVSQLVAEGLIEGLGLACDVVSDGEGVLQALALSHYDLVLMDCHMPNLDGFEATAQLRALEALKSDPRLPVVALTAGVMNEERQRCFAVGMDDVVSKPVSTEQLAEVFRRWLHVDFW